MHSRSISIAACLSVLGSAAPVLAQSPGAPAEIRKHHNPVIDLLEQSKPVFGLYAPSNPRTGSSSGERRRNSCDSLVYLSLARMNWLGFM
jgi:hypothetical protein